jgi:hypothetical protein
MKNLLIVLVVMAVGHLAASKTTNEEATILNKILKDYDPRVRPVRNHNDVVNVTLKVTPADVIEQKGPSNLYTIYAFVYMKWMDSSLTWNRSENGGVERIRTSPVLGDKTPIIWIPDITMWSGRTTEADIYPQRAFIDHNGTVQWAPYRVFSDVPCKLLNPNQTTQQKKIKCTVKLGSWIHPQSCLTVNGLTESKQPDGGRDDSAWKLTAQDFNAGDLPFDNDPSNWTQITYTFEFTKNANIF